MDAYLWLLLSFDVDYDGGYDEKDAKFHENHESEKGGSHKKGHHEKHHENKKGSKKGNGKKGQHHHEESG